MNQTLLRLFFILSFLTAFVFLTIVTLPPSSQATTHPSSPNESQKKRSRAKFVPGDVLVRYQSESAARRQTRATTSLSVDGRSLPILVERFGGSEIVEGLRIAHVMPADTLIAIEALKKQPDVIYAEPNYILHLDATPNDPSFDQLYGLTKVGAPQAWDTQKGCNAIVVGVVDGGIDISHPDLQANIWTNPTPGFFAGISGDLHGYDFAHDTGTISADDHATHVAGIVGAKGNNGIGVVGVNWDVSLMSLKFISGLTGDASDAIRACNYAKQMRDLWVRSGGASGANVRLLNNSYGGDGFNQSFLDAINALNQSGILFVAAAGNTDTKPEPNNEVVPHYPSSYNAPNVVAVAATNQSDGLASFSHFGNYSVHLGAPGTSILSTTPKNESLCVLQSTDPSGYTYSSCSGTSMSSPHVAGAAALLLAQNPNLTVQQLKNLLLFNGEVESALIDKTVTGRRLNVFNSLQALGENDATPPGSVANLQVNTQTGRSVNLGWSASGDDGATGQASLYQVSFADTTTGTVFPLKNLIPASSGSPQTLDIKVPYRHTTGAINIREFDNVGNEGAPASLNVTVPIVDSDPYTTALGNPVALSTAGTALALRSDDSYKENYPLPFAFPFFGQNFTSVTISTNGNLYFSPPPKRSNGEADDVPGSSADLARSKMISGLWDDLRTDRHASDDVYAVAPDSSRIIFRWQAVTFGDGTPSTEFPVNFEIELRTDGTIQTRYGAGQSAPTNTHLLPVVGISGGEPDAYVVSTHTSEQTEISLTNAQEVTFLPRALAPAPTPTPIPTPTPTPTNASIQFSTGNFSVGEAAGTAIITVLRSGNTSGTVTVNYGSSPDFLLCNVIAGYASQRSDYTTASGTLSFGPGETSKTFQILITDDVYVEGDETLSLSLIGPTGDASLGSPSTATLTIQDNDNSTPTLNPSDDATYFVRQQYSDFLAREPDAGGLAFWTNEINSCPPGNQPCVNARRVAVSNAFFFEPEFQQTGSYVFRLYRAAYGKNQPFPNPDPDPRVPGLNLTIPNYVAFNLDRAQVIGGAGLAQSQLNLANAFVQRPEFINRYPTSLSPQDFITGVLATIQNADASVDLSSQQSALLNLYNQGGRGAVMYRLADDNMQTNPINNRAFIDGEYNLTFVTVEYFGYLRRDADTFGLNFWLGQMNRFPLRDTDVQHAMVCSFITSSEYQQRFSPVATHSNQECPQ